MKLFIRGVDNPLLGFIGVHVTTHDVKSAIRTPLEGLIADIITHPQWNPTTRNADIAIVRLKNDIVYTSIKYFSMFLIK